MIEEFNVPALATDCRRDERTVRLALNVLRNFRVLSDGSTRCPARSGSLADERRRVDLGDGAVAGGESLRDRRSTGLESDIRVRAWCPGPRGYVLDRQLEHSVGYWTTWSVERVREPIKVARVHAEPSGVPDLALEAVDDGLPVFGMILVGAVSERIKSAFNASSAAFISSSRGGIISTIDCGKRPFGTMARYCFRYSAENAAMRSGSPWRSMERPPLNLPSWTGNSTFVPWSGDSGIVQKHSGSPVNAPDVASAPLRCRLILRRSRWPDGSVGRYKPEGGPDLATAVRTGQRIHDLDQ